MKRIYGIAALATLMLLTAGLIVNSHADMVNLTGSYVSITTNAKMQRPYLRPRFTVIAGDSSGAHLAVSGGGFAVGDPILAMFEMDTLANSAVFLKVVNPDSAFQQTADDTIQVKGVTATGTRYLIMFHDATD
jgi:hypothetical protein